MLGVLSMFPALSTFSTFSVGALSTFSTFSVGALSTFSTFSIFCAPAKSALNTLRALTTLIMVFETKRSSKIKQYMTNVNYQDRR